MIVVSIQDQMLYKIEQDRVLYEMPISSGKNGIGQEDGSYKTPLGLHYAAELFGIGKPINAVFVARRHTGEIYSESLAEQYPNRDWILTRIIRLSGLEPGYNVGGNVDTYSRYIYLHGCPDSCSLIKPDSHGCIRMRNQDIIALFDDTKVGEPIYLMAPTFHMSQLEAIYTKLYLYTLHDILL